MHKNKITNILYNYTKATVSWKFRWRNLDLKADSKEFHHNFSYKYKSWYTHILLILLRTETNEVLSSLLDIPVSIL